MEPKFCLVSFELARTFNGMLKRCETLLGQEEAGTEGFKYLLSMKMWSLTENKVQEWEIQPTLLGGFP